MAEASKIEDSNALEFLYFLLGLRTWLESYIELREEGNLRKMQDLMNHMIKELDDGTYG